MPLYEYRCENCKVEFERLVRGAEDVTCPTCGSAGVQRLLSLFAVDSDATRKSNLAAAKKIGRREQRDRAIAEREAAEHHDH